MTTATINGYTVDLESDGDCTQCWVGKGRFTASLGILEAEGVLTDSNTDATLEVPQTVIDRIMAFACSKGY